MAELLPPIDKVTLVVTTASGEVLSTLPPEYRPEPDLDDPEGVPRRGRPHDS